MNITNNNFQSLENVVVNAHKQFSTETNDNFQSLDASLINIQKQSHKNEKSINITNKSLKSVQNELNIIKQHSINNKIKLNTIHNTLQTINNPYPMKIVDKINNNINAMNTKLNKSIKCAQNQTAKQLKTMQKQLSVNNNEMNEIKNDLMLQSVTIQSIRTQLNRTNDNIKTNNNVPANVTNQSSAITNSGFCPGQKPTEHFDANSVSTQINAQSETTKSIANITNINKPTTQEMELNNIDDTIKHNSNNNNNVNSLTHTKPETFQNISPGLSTKSTITTKPTCATTHIANATNINESIQNGSLTKSHPEPQIRKQINTIKSPTKTYAKSATKSPTHAPKSPIKYKNEENILYNTNAFVNVNNTSVSNNNNNTQNIASFVSNNDNKIPPTKSQTDSLTPKANNTISNAQSIQNRSLTKSPHKPQIHKQINTTKSPTKTYAKTYAKSPTKSPTHAPKSYARSATKSYASPTESPTKSNTISHTNHNDCEPSKPSISNNNSKLTKPAASPINPSINTTANVKAPFKPQIRNPMTATTQTKSPQISPTKYKNEGNKLYKSGRYVEAIVKYKQAQNMDPKEPMYQMNESAALFMMEKYDECILCCNQIIDMTKDPKWLYKAYKRLGSIEEKRNNMMPAMMNYKNAINQQWDDSLQNKIQEFVIQQKSGMTIAELNKHNGKDWKCINCEIMVSSEEVECQECGLHCSMTEEDLSYMFDNG